LGLRDVSVSVWVLFPLEVIIDSGLANGKYRESLHHITELSRVWLFGALDIGMVLLDHIAISFFDLFRRRSVGNTENRVVLLLGWDS
jgi:hypothetical protein